MKVFLIIFLFSFSLSFGMAQDSTVVIANSLFTDMEEINIGRMDGWIFKEGNQPVWANENIDLTGWKKRKPEELSVTDADNNGRVEGWFRMRVKTDNSLSNMPIGFRYTGWGAAELFVDGKLIQSYGSGGNNGKPFQEYNPIHRFSIPIKLGLEKGHIIAIHFIDYVSDFPLPKQIKSNAFLKIKQYTFTNSLFSLTGPKFNSAFENKLYTHLVFKTSIAAFILIITILFWLVSYQNSKEISLRMIKIFSVIGFLFSFIKILGHSQLISFNTYIAGQCISNLLSFLILALIPIIITEGLQQKIKLYLKLLCTIELLIGIISLFFYSYLIIVPLITFNIISSLVSSYLIIHSWKIIKGAQWAIIAGFGNLALCSCISTLFLTNASFQLYLVLESLIFLSIPFAYVVYISLRFREIIYEVQKNASQLVLISEEKKELVAMQNEMLENQVAERTSALNQSLQDLKSTQKQLIQSEKMASLGELTAGIAHEIQNPLNFVNNFSEVNKELLAELNDEIDKGNYEDVKAIAKDVTANEEKINHHGKRADAIVKGMLQHSRSSSGVKEPTDINAMADEYLRLAYHGLRAKDKSFNATLVTDFDPYIGTINIIPQDIGRVILNLITNAFYVVDEKKKMGIADYEPTVSVTTQKTGNQILISVKDNGNGIPKHILDKIFQPFFTTKPTGKGTGLGLSLSYDIVKAHGGELKVETKEGDRTIFIIKLPIN